MYFTCNVMAIHYKQNKVFTITFKIDFNIKKMLWTKCIPHSLLNRVDVSFVAKVAKGETDCF